MNGTDTQLGSSITLFRGYVRTVVDWIARWEGIEGKGVFFFCVYRMGKSALDLLSKKEWINGQGILTPYCFQSHVSGGKGCPGGA